LAGAVEELAAAEELAARELLDRSHRL
jgi:hypothetical protein